MSHPQKEKIAAGITLAVLGFASSSGATGPAKLLWQTELPPPLPRPFEVYEGAYSVAAKDGVVVAAGRVGGFGHADMAIRAYDRRSGAPLWQEKLDLANGYDAAYSAAAWGRLATVLGEFDGPYESGLVLRTYEARTGELLWEEVV